MSETQRCPWCGTDPLYVHYHDTVWGRPEWNPQALFEKLCLDGQQAGLSWITILRKQETYREAYDGFDPEKIVRYNDQKVAELLANPGVIRNRLKVQSIIKNARGFLDLQEKGDNFADFLWKFVDGAPIQNHWQTFGEVPVTTPEAEAMSKALKKAGFTFVGPTIVYAFMQAVGMVNDHLVACPQHRECRALGN
ncbi:DNA-3-methyladenine glycosylase I [Marinobacter sp. F4216]|uniref:DNA-3-methyladenine glycosylase I n=1 Tax=Marinobacter sp. F4216 TaxID=2874281 RepID=UPI001CC11AEF|nr:DNA-3-methyladenine glycosylase I [Marinobacter sp. F4216]MBZ2169679.1 DNA-3-methyladenine glycosylase I [Marinobacter sp. F4216]